MILVDSSSLVTSLCLIAGYLVYVRYCRYQHLNNLIKKYPDPRVILDNHDIAIEIYSDILRKEYPLLARFSLEFALFKPFATSSVSKLLLSTKQFTENCARRIEDTELILSEIIDFYPRTMNELKRNPELDEKDKMKQHQRRDASIKRLNEIHGHYSISNDDYLFTLYLFVTESLRWLNSWGWRKLDIRETNAIFKVWHEIGTKMNIRDIPDTLEEWQINQKKYESEFIKYHPANRACADASLKQLGKKLPGFMLPLLYKTLPCLLEKSECDALGLQDASLMMRIIFNTTICLHVWFVRYFCLPRSKYDLRTPFYPNKHGKYVPRYFVYNPAIYKNGYRIEELGPEKFMPKCPHFQ